MKVLLNKLLPGLALVLLAVTGAFGQGATTATISGLIADENGEPLVGATVVALHEPSGTRYGTATRVDGRYTIPGARVGGPYTITATYTGFENQVASNIYLSLGSVFRHDAIMKTSATLLDAVTVVAQKDLLNTEKNGASTHISEEEIQVLPTISRDLTDFARLTPQANILGDNIISIAGANNRFNSIYIDGAVNNDVFGLAASGTNGGQTGITAISPDAIEQFQIVVAPYDVKLSGFAGGGINAVTRSGSNEIEGSAYWFTRNERLSGLKVSLPDTLPKDERRLPEFSANTYGLRLSGPIIKNKAFFFINAELQRDETPQPFDFSDYNGNSSQAQIEAFANRLREFGYDPGEFLSKTHTLDGEKVLVRFDFNLNQNHKLMLRHHYTKGTATYDQFSSSSRIRFANTGIFFPTTTNSTALELTSVFGEKMSNNLIIGFTNVKDDRDPVGDPFPAIEIQDGGGIIVAGSEQFSTANALDQKILTLTDNFNLYLGKHNLTFGTHNEFFDMYNLFIRQSYGYYRYSNLDSFMLGGLPNRYQRTYSLIDDGVEDGGGAAADFNALQLGFYAQDEYHFSDRFSASLGLRVDIPMFLDQPAEARIFNETAAEQLVAAGYDLQGARAGQAPGAQILFSPRLGFNYDIKGDRSYVLRGGGGLFTSRIPFVWPGGMYTNNGLLLASVDAQGGDFGNNPDFEFSPDINNQYTNEDFGKTAGVAQLDLFAEDFKYPQMLRASLALDAKLPWGMLGTVEGIYSKTINNLTYQNINKTPSFGNLQGADDRPVYNGTNISSSFTDIILGYNTNKGDSYSITAQVQKAYTRGWTGSVAYTYGQARVINDLTSSQNSSNWRFNEAIGSHNDLPLSYSDFDLGHRLTAFVSKRLEYGGKLGGATTISLFYNGQSGQRYSYTYIGRLLNDDFQNNQDLIFVPESSDQINLVDDAAIGTAAEQWAALDQFIENDPYLSTRRGQYAERNGARLPFTNIVDFKAIQEFYVTLGNKRRAVQVSLDVFNFSNMLNAKWGRRFFVTNDNFSLITVSRGGVDNTTPTYKFKAPTRVGNIDEAGFNSSIWQAQLGVRLLF